MLDRGYLDLRSIKLSLYGFYTYFFYLNFDFYLEVSVRRLIYHFKSLIVKLGVETPLAPPLLPLYRFVVLEVFLDSEPNPRPVSLPLNS